MRSYRNLNTTCSAGGFTLVEMLAAITIVGLVIAVSVPSTQRFYESMQYRQALRDVTAALSSARYQAINDGVASDAVIDPAHNTLQVGGDTLQLPGVLTLSLSTAREVNRGDKAVIRFYPEGGSSGGDIDIVRDTGAGSRISVDWLIGSVSLGEYELEQGE